MTTPDKPQDWPGPEDLEKPTLAELFAKKRRMGGMHAPVMPYVGIAGFTTVHEVRGIAADLYTMNPYGSTSVGGRRLAVGVLATWETLNGEPAAGNPELCPKIGDVRALFDAAVEPIRHYSPGLGQKEGDGTTLPIEDRTLRLIHYKSREPNLAAQVDRLCEIAGPNLSGFKFNIAWPDARDIHAISDDYPALRIILQVSREMFSNVSRNTQLLVNEIKAKYYPHVTDILFDMSAGTGVTVDMQETAAVIEALYDAFGGAVKGGLGIGIAGGLKYQNVYDLKPFLDRWPDLSLDAETKIRDTYQDWITKEPRSFLNENAREFARRAVQMMLPASRTQTTP